MPHTKKAKYTDYISRIPVTAEMKKKVLAIAEKDGEGVAAIVRSALDVFLSKNDINIPTK